MNHTKEEACFHLKINIKSLNRMIEKGLIKVTDENNITNEELYRILLQDKFYSMDWIDANTLEYQEIIYRKQIQELYLNGN